jgi:hypothetical protein
MRDMGGVDKQAQKCYEESNNSFLLTIQSVTRQVIVLEHSSFFDHKLS